MNGATTQAAAMVLAGNGPAVVKADQTRAFEPRSVDEALELARLLAMSGFLGRNVTRPEQAFAIIAVGRELGLTAMQSLRSIHIIEGKPMLSADLIASLCKSRPDICKYFQVVETSDRIATIRTHRAGDPEPTTMSFSIEDAQRAQLTGKDNWKKYPAAMLRARCTTALARAVYPDLAMGLYDPDEIADVPAMPAYEVVPQPAPAPKRVVDGATFQKLCDRVDAAENGPTLNNIASATSKAHKAGQITDAQFDQLKHGVTKKREVIGAANTQPAPPSEPAEVPDPDPFNGADIDQSMRQPGDD